MLREGNAFEALLNSATSIAEPAAVGDQPQARGRRPRRKAVPGGSSASDEETTITGASSSSSSPTRAGILLHRTTSLNGRSSADGGTVRGSVELQGSPMLFGQRHQDFPIAAWGLQQREPVEAHTARPVRTCSELALSPGTASYAPSTSRQDDPPLTPPSPLKLTSPGMTPILEASFSPHPHAAAPAPAAPAVATAKHPPRTVPAPHGITHRPQSVHAYISAELQPGPSYAVADVVWGQTERDRVYNALMAVPYQLERLVWFGVALCLDSFLAVFTLLPIRVAAALWTATMCMLRSVGLRGRSVASGPGASASGGTADAPPASAPPLRLRGDQLFDLLCAAMFAGVVAFLWRLEAGAIYYWVKELTQEFLKLSVLNTALELGDKICCSFGVDVLEALAASCTALAAGPHWSWSAVGNVASDATVATALLLAHGAALMSQALVYGVAMNSRKNTLLALLIASNFTEIKGTVLKRFDPTKLFVLACQDVVERFHLLIVLAFVLVEEAGSTPFSSSSRLLRHCGYVVLAEVVIDVTKHAVLGKFNEIRPGVYREFMKDLCEKVSGAQSHSMHRLVGFEPFAPAALFLRVAFTFSAVRRESAPATPGTAGTAAWGAAGVLRAGLYIAAAAVCWAALVALKIMLGYLLKRGAVVYLQRYEERRNRGRAAAANYKLRSLTSGVSAAPFSTAPSATVDAPSPSASKKED